MLVADVVESTELEVWLWVIGALVVIHLVSLRYRHGLRKFNGPFLASFTDLWRMCHAYTNNNRAPMVHLHKKYGDVVRVGPNVLSFAQPQAIKDIYGRGKAWEKVRVDSFDGDQVPPILTFAKSDYYPVQAAVAKGELAHTLFSSPDMKWHNNLKKSVSASFTMSAVMGYEHLVDTTIEVYLKELRNRFAGKSGKQGLIDLHTWLLYFSFDVIGELTYGARHGFIESSSDIAGIIQFVRSFLNYGFIAGQMPIVDKFLRHNPVLLWLEKQGLYQGSTFPGVPFAVGHIRGRVDYYANRKASEFKDREDLLDKFLKAKAEHPDIVTDKEVLGLSLSMMIAGAETTGISLTAIFYYLLKTRGCYARLQDELDQHFPPSDLGAFTSATDFSASRRLPYLHACIQEGFRLHPAFGFNFERVVPTGGETICGHFVQGGVVVGVNSWVVHRDKVIFGEDVERYRPERWLEASKDKLNEMNRTMFQFGTGNHVCLGRNISLLEIYKLVPSLMRAFRVSLDDDVKEWELWNGANVRMSGVNVRLAPRHKTGNNKVRV